MNTDGEAVVERASSENRSMEQPLETRTACREPPVVVVVLLLLLAQSTSDLDAARGGEETVSLCIDGLVDEISCSTYLGGGGGVWLVARAARWPRWIIEG
jgi:hypothetical protein